MNKPFLRQLISGVKPPEQPEFHAFLDRVMNNEADKSEVIAFLSGLSAKPLCLENVENFVSYYFKLTPAKRLEGSEGAVNVVGTGGGSIGTFNISTAAAFVASAAGAKVLKSGSAAYSSQCGSLDVLQALGVPMPESEAQMAEMVGEFNLGLIPPSHYGPLLKQLFIKALPIAFRDIAGFVNTIGPLLCPYQVSGRLVGVGQPQYLDVFSTFYAQHQQQNTLLVYADCGMDEFCSIGINHYRLVDAGIQRWELSTRKLGFGHGELGELAGGAPLENAAILRSILSNQRLGEARNTVVLNSAALLFLANKAASIEAGIQLAETAITEGAALNQLNRLVDWGSRLKSKNNVAMAVNVS